MQCVGVGVGVGVCTLERSAKDWNSMTLEGRAEDPPYRTLQAFQGTWVSSSSDEEPLSSAKQGDNVTRHVS